MIDDRPRRALVYLVIISGSLSALEASKNWCLTSDQRTYQNAFVAALLLQDSPMNNVVQFVYVGINA
jgi:hypothetical protein